MSFTAANVADAVRVIRLAPCAAPVEKPVDNVTAHCLYASSVAVAAVNLSAALLLPEVPLVEAANVVLPHPLRLRLPNVVNVKVGRTMVTTSPASSFEFKENVKLSDVGAAETGLEITKAL